MDYCLFKLKFTSSVHIGDSSMATSLETADFVIRADTFFSALCHAALDLFGEEGIERLYNAAKSGEFRISDTLPYKDGKLYIPKPNISIKRENVLSNDERKAFRKISHLPILLLDKYLAGAMKPQEADCDFCIQYVVDKVNLRNPKKSEPYSVALVDFHDNCGLSVIVGYEDKDFLEVVKRLIIHLGIGGIGGKVSSGYGKFDVAEVVELKESAEEQYMILNEMLTGTDSDFHILISTALPRDEELDSAMQGATFGMTRRGGFVQSVSYSNTPLKKKTQYFFSSGSVFHNLFEGDVYDVGLGGNHAVYRYGIPVFLGVNRK